MVYPIIPFLAKLDRSDSPFLPIGCKIHIGYQALGMKMKELGDLKFGLEVCVKGVGKGIFCGSPFPIFNTRKLLAAQ
jgi:hypothetical protein